MTDRDGLFQAADGGTLLLDEIGDMPMGMQVKLLRVLQERKVKRVGDHREVPVDVRVIAATNRELADEVEAGRFREDLYYRLNVICIELPPLRDRPADIGLLAQHFLKKYADEFGKDIKSIEPDVLQRLHRHPFNGNVRELENLIERATALAEGNSIAIEHLPPGFGQQPLGTGTVDSKIELTHRGLKSRCFDQRNRRAPDRTGSPKDGRSQKGCGQSARHHLSLIAISPRQARHYINDCRAPAEGDARLESLHARYQAVGERLWWSHEVFGLFPWSATGGCS